MRESKPLQLRVSLVPDEAPSSIGSMGGTGLSTNSGVSDSLQRTPRAKVKANASETGEPRVGTRENGGMTKDGANAVQDPDSARERTPAAQQPDVPTGDDAQSTPWLLDICLVRIAGVYELSSTFVRALCVQFCGLRSASHLVWFCLKVYSRGDERVRSAVTRAR